MRSTNEEIQDFRRYFTGLPRRDQAVEKVVVGPVGSPKHLKNQTKALKTGVLST
jgi:hypothetical protein